MIARYTRAEMEKVWSAETKFSKLLEVEVAVARAQANLKIIPEEAAAAIEKKGRFSIREIEEIEKQTKHDVIAFVTNVAKKVGEHGKFVHFGMTSSDVLDTSFSLVLRDAQKVLNKTLARLEKSLSDSVKKHKNTVCVGRTHGIHAEPTTFGWKLAGYLAELRRNRRRFDQAIEEAQVAKLSGPVGTYSTQSSEVEQRVADELKLETETVATQVVPRDRHAQVIFSIALLCAGVERLAVELRHLQRTEVGEVEEGFTKGQKGSSAMPHKKNPIGSENITGLSRIVRSFVHAALEDVVLWHERDISHSSVERVIFPDAFILADYAADRMTLILENLVVKKERMKENLDLTGGQVMSAQVLLALVQKGYSREDAYKIIQKASHSLKNGESLKDKLRKDPRFKKKMSVKETEDLFSGRIKQVNKLFQRVLKEDA